MNARVTILQDVTVHEEAADAEARNESFEAEVLTLEQPAMELRSREPLATGTAVRIDTSDAIWLGEATDCVASGEGFAICIRLRHVLRDFDTLARLAERFGTAAAKGTPVQI